ncbi:response regulator [Sphingomonas psychrolutea]|uniref:DNA-binding response regulator n=1 Tax=Sphingomonas psychrolutea TaxID=1259676 RepID=A0ABQ1GGJ0_9SPHN|nr:response regulator [Sphingomonas psychrolutea]GGA43091.1 DNA-binding response regulator [Sphingomonas psychrolutea]
MTVRTVFVVEDDPKIAAVLADYLRAGGYGARVFPDGRAVVAAVRAEPPAAMILDLGLPGMDGMAICAAVRAFSAVPILMLTARVEQADRLAGLDGGADDYVCKPFEAREVMARVNAMIRRAEGRVTRDASALPWVIDEDGQRVAWRGTWLDLSPSEFCILAAMVRSPGRVFTRDQLLDRLGTRALDSGDRAIDSHMKNIRRKIARVEPDAACVASVYGVGYRFEG